MQKSSESAGYRSNWWHQNNSNSLPMLMVTEYKQTEEVFCTKIVACLEEADTSCFQTRLFSKISSWTSPILISSCTKVHKMWQKLWNILMTRKSKKYDARSSKSMCSRKMPKYTSWNEIHWLLSQSRKKKHNVTLRGKKRPMADIKILSTQPEKGLWTKGKALKQFGWTLGPRIRSSKIGRIAVLAPS